MNITLWILQFLLALHTAIGAMWKFSHTPEQTMPSLHAIPNEAWIAMSIFELLCCLGLLIPLVYKRVAILAPLAAIGIALEMLLFCGVHLASGDATFGPMIYWLVVAAICAFIAYGRFALKPLQ